ncbi:MAG: ferrous iron transport protein A [Tissierellia bacterium]|nr:ferrous iron transport protein A [Tissierellia bacterium]
MLTLDKVDLNQEVRITAINGERALKRRIMDMGITKGTNVKIVRVAPLGDPIDILVRGYQLSIRMADAEHISVETI